MNFAWYYLAGLLAGGLIAYMLHRMTHRKHDCACHDELQEKWFGWINDKGLPQYSKAIKLSETDYLCKQRMKVFTWYTNIGIWAPYPGQVFDDLRHVQRWYSALTEAIQIVKAQEAQARTNPTQVEGDK